jgi:hypothetical protein
MRIVRRLSLALAMTALVAPSPAGAEPWSAPIYRAPKGPKNPPPAPLSTDVETAEQLFAKLEFDDANKVAERVAKLRALTHDQLVRAYKILAITHGFLDHEDQARDAFVLLLTYEPDYQADQNLGPKVMQPFVEARGFWRAQSSKPGVDVSTDLRAREAGVLRVTTRDPTHVVKKVTVGWRWGSNGEFSSSTIGAGTGVTVEVAQAPAGKTRLEYYAQALDERDDIAFETGNPSVPKSAIAETNFAPTPPPPAEKSSGFVGSPVFWAIAGVVVVGGAATGGYFLFRPKDSSTASSATLTPSLMCGATKCN